MSALFTLTSEAEDFISEADMEDFISEADWKLEEASLPISDDEPWKFLKQDLIQGNLYIGGRCTTACAVVNQLFNKLFWKRNFEFLLFQQLSVKLIDNCISGSAPSPAWEVKVWVLWDPSQN